MISRSISQTCPCCGAPIEPDRVILDEATQSLAMSGSIIVFSKQEFVILETLIQSRPRVVSRDAIYDALYGLLPDCDGPELKIIDTHICKIRKKIAAVDLVIETRWGIGYALVVPPKAADALTAQARALKSRRRAA